MNNSDEPLFLAAWLKANAKHMKSPQEIDRMLRAAMVMEKLHNELSKQKAVGDGERKPVPAMWR
jgi:hypothetical protein